MLGESRRSTRAVLLVIMLANPWATSCAAPEEPPAVETEAAKLRDAALAGSGAWEILRSLMVEVGPRFAGSAGDARAVAWGVATMKRLGLENVRAEPVTVPRWVRGDESGEIMAPFPQPMALTALGGSVGTVDEGLEAEVVEAASLQELDGMDEEVVRGKIVFFNARMERRRDGSGYGETVPVRGYGAIRAARKGAVGVLIRSVGTGTHRFPHTGAMRYEEDVPKIPAAALAIPDADVLERQLAGEAVVRFRLRLGARYEGEAQSANVIGEVPGSEEPGEVVLLGAHLDAWDLSAGAHDDGAGCAIVLEAARLIAASERPPRRTVRVVLFANEEFGLSGAKAYAEAHADELERHVLAMESDFGAGRVWGFRAGVEANALPRMKRAAALLAPLGIEWLGGEARGGADLRPLRAAGVPVADIIQDGTFYFDYHHTADDTLDKVDPEALAQNVAAYVTVAYLAAE